MRIEPERRSRSVIALCWLCNVMIAAAGDAGEASGDCNDNGVPDGRELRGLELGAPTAFHVETAPLLSALVPHDVDGDGDVDLLASSPLNRKIALLRSDGKGLLEPAIAMEASATDMAPADFDGDQLLDLAMVSLEGDGVVVIPGLAGGSFKPPDFGDVVERIEAPSALSVADLNRDGLLDLLVPIRNQCDCAHVLINLGSRKFAAPLILSAGLNPFDAAILDVDADGWPDAAITSHNGPGLVPYINQRNGAGGEWGGLAQAPPTVLDSHPTAILPGDIDGDRDVDLLVAHTIPDGVSLLFNDGAGRFADAGSRLATGPEVTSIAGGDLNGDELLDLVVADTAAGEVKAALGRDGAAFELADAAVLADRPNAVALLDSDLDGTLEVAAAARGILLFRDAVFGRDCNRNGIADDCDLGGGGSADCNSNAIPDECDTTGSLELEVSGEEHNLSSRQWSVDAGNTDGDPRIDLVFGIDGAGPHHASYLPNGGAPVELRTVHDARVVRLSDLDGDGSDDLYVAGVDGVSTFLSREGGFGAPAFQSLRDLAPFPVLADFDGDGDLDALAGNRTLVIFEALLNDGHGALEARLAFRPTSFSLDVAVGDFDGDGDPDLAQSRGSEARIALHLNDGRAAFSGGGALRGGRLLHSLAAADLDADGDTDLGCVDLEPGSVLAFLNGGDGSFSAPTERAVPSTGNGLEAVDLDRDGKIDLFGLGGGGGLNVLQNEGGARLRPPVHFAGGEKLVDLVAVDLDADGDGDVVAASGGRSFAIFVNGSEPSASPDRDADGAPDECARPEFHRGDANADGSLDVSDGQCVLRFLFEGGTRVPCLEAADANNDGAVDCSDSIAVLGYLFLGTAAPAEPGPPPSSCGGDVDAAGSPGDLGCGDYAACLQ